MNEKKNITSQLFQEALNFHKSNNYEKAEIIYKKILKLEPSHFETLLKIGTLYVQCMKLNEAKESLENAEKINPYNPDLLNNLGYLFILIKDYKAATNYFERIIKINPSFEKAFFNLGILHNNQNKFKKAIEYFKKTISVNPKNTDAYNRIGNILVLLKEYGLAISYYKKSLEIKPNDEKILCNLGGIALVFNETENYQEAILCFEKAIKINSNCVDAYNGLGHIYHVTIGNIEKSIAFFQKAIQINPKYFKAYYNLGNLYREIGECENAKNFYKKASDINPDFIKSYSNLLICTCYSHQNNNYLEITKKFENFLTKFKKKKFVNFKTSNKKSLKVGFLSADFRNHPVGYFLSDVIKNLKNKNIKLYAYSDHHIIDETTKVLKKDFNNWLNVSKRNDSDIIDLIRNDKIDILFDLAGHTGNKLNVFKNRCSPIQITWCGWLASTGIKEIDYIIGDPYATPTNDQYKFVEKIYPLNKIWCCLPTSNLGPEIKINKNNNKYITFGCFNKVSKINDKVISIWSKILKQIPKSILILKSGSYDKQYIRSNILKKFKVCGINNERIILERKSPRRKLLEYYNKIDIALDTFPYNGGTTSFEAAYMGVPIITMENNSFMFRCGESINKNLGMDDWIAKNEEDYILKALKFSENKNYLTNLKNELRNIALKSPLFNSENFSKDFYKMLLDIARK